MDFIVVFLLIPLVIGVFLSPQAVVRWLLGLVLGGYSFAAFTNTLNTQYGFMHSNGDMDITPLVIAFIGAILGSMTGLTVLLHKKDNPCGIGVFSLVVALPFLTLFALSLFGTLQEYHTPQYHPIEKAFAESGPGLLWSSLLVLRGVWLIRSARRAPAPAKPEIAS